MHRRLYRRAFCVLRRSAEKKLVIENCLLRYVCTFVTKNWKEMNEWEWISVFFYAQKILNRRSILLHIVIMRAYKSLSAIATMQLSNKHASLSSEWLAEKFPFSLFHWFLCFSQPVSDAPMKNWQAWLLIAGYLSKCNNSRDKKNGHFINKLR